MRYLVVTLGAVALVAILEGCRQIYRWYDDLQKEELTSCSAAVTPHNQSSTALAFSSEPSPSTEPVGRRAARGRPR